MASGRFRRLLAPGALFLGLAFFGGSVLILGALASQPASTELAPSTLTAANGTGVLLYQVHNYVNYWGKLDVSFSFPQAAGNAYYVACDDFDAVLAGQTPTSPLMKFGPVHNGSFVVSSQTVSPYDLYSKVDRHLSGACHVAVAFTWNATGNDPEPNKPTARLVLSETRFTGDAVLTMLALSVGGAMLVLLGGLAWARQRSPPELPELAEGTAEALRRSLDRMGAQLERTRRHLLFAGVLGVFLWYPILVPWTWHLTASATDDPLAPWFIAAATLGFLVVLTILWAREFLRLDREVNAWRARMNELREKEEGLYASLDRPEG